MKNRIALSMAAVFVLAASGCGDGDDEVVPDAASTPMVDAADPPDIDAAPPAGVGEGFVRFTLTDEAVGPAYVSVADLDGDGTEEVIVSSFGNLDDLFAGTLRIYRRGAGLGEWTGELVSDAYRYPNQTTVKDLDGDGDLDIFLPAGFFPCVFLGGACGALVWFEQTPGGWEPHEIVTEDALFYHHVELVDVDGDEIDDLVTVGESFQPPSTGAAEARWYKGTASGDRFESTPQTIGAGLGSFPRVHDLDGDGDLDVASAEFFHAGGSFAWFERGGTDEAPTWTRHVIDDQSGPSIMLTLVDDLYGDGALRALGANHTNTERDPPDEWPSAVYAFEIPEDPTQPWTRTTISTGIVSRPGDLQMNRYDAPGIFGSGDVDGDGDLDVVVSGDGDPRAFWLEQTTAGAFTTHVLQEDIGQAGGMVVVDLDDDGKAEVIVTGYEDSVVYLYERE